MSVDLEQTRTEMESGKKLNHSRAELAANQPGRFSTVVEFFLLCRFGPIVPLVQPATEPGSLKNPAQSKNKVCL